ncbi:MAG: MerR family transcriptional regulator [Bradymonadaceae bacterium]
MAISPDSSRLSIGAVAEATGIPAGTLRTWERRYGFPDPERTDSGHRRYAPEMLDHLRLTARAIDAGHRASDVVGLDESELSELVSQTRSHSGRAEPSGRGEPTGLDGTQADGSWTEDWLDRAEVFDEEGLERRFRADWNRLGALPFLQKRATPFLRALGEAWRSGEFDVAQEHHTSEVLRDFLSEQWRRLASPDTDRRVVCATPEREQHALGLHLAAVVFGLAEWQVVFVGPNTPVPDIVEARRNTEANTVAVSFARSYDEEKATDVVDRLLRGLEEEFELVVGGDGAPPRTTGIRHFDDLETLYEWTRSHEPGP